MPQEKVTPIFSESFIELQLKDFEFRRQELEFKRKQNESSYEFAKKSLQYQSEEIKNQRELEVKKEKHGLYIIISAIVLMFSLIIIAMAMNKDELLIEMGRVLGYIFGGGITGYGLGLKNGNHKPKPGKQT